MKKKGRFSIMLIFGCNDLLSAHKIRDLWVFNFTETMLQFTAILPFNLVVFLQKKVARITDHFWL
ncbi:MAG: hypothetical protein CFE23_01325 [Flavobacterium sp. BFFFF1]|nr:MAG: hypothetical protein CFE23_01325 [Flavobacterium sp. BFFFF1]